MGEMQLKTARGFKLGTKISTIKVPPELEVKHTTGFDWLDDALGGEGGFTRTSTIMLTGGAGCGKSTLMRQLASSMTGVGHKVVYNVGEESLIQVRMATRRLKLKNDFMLGEERRLPDLLQFMGECRKSDPNKIPVLLQDSLQTLDDGKYADGGTTGNTPVRCTEKLVDWSQESMGLVVFIGQVNKSGEFAGKNAIKHAIDVHIHLHFDTDKKSPVFGCLLLEVTKNRWGCNGKTYVMALTDEGMVVRGSFDKVAGKVHGDEEE